MTDVLLALDLATTLGFAVGKPGERPAYGVAVNTGEDNGEIGLDYFCWLGAMIERHKPTVLVYEAPILVWGRTSIDVATRLMGLAFLTDVVAKQKNIDVVFKCDTNEVAHAFTAAKFKGREEKKAAVIAECVRRGWPVESDNDADALALFVFAESLLFSGARALELAP